MSEENDGNKKALSWFGHHWVMITMIVVGGIIILGVLKFVSQLLNGTGPLSKGIGDSLGSLANFVNGITNSCTTQPDCGTIEEQDICSSMSGCAWSGVEQSGDTGSCINNTGRKTGEGGFFSPGCGLFLGMLTFFVASLLLLIFKAALPSKNKNLDITVKLEGKPKTDIIEIVAEKAVKTGEKAKDDLEKTKKEKLSDAEIQSLGESAGNVEARKSAIDAIDAQSGSVDPTTRAKQKAEVDANHAVDEKVAEERAEKNGVNPKERSKGVDAVERASKGVHNVSTFYNNRVRSYMQYNIPMSPVVVKHFAKRLTSHGIILEQDVHNYFMRYIKI